MLVLDPGKFQRWIFTSSGQFQIPQSHTLADDPPQIGYRVQDQSLGQKGEVTDTCGFLGWAPQVPRVPVTCLWDLDAGPWEILKKDEDMDAAQGTCALIYR